MRACLLRVRVIAAHALCLATIVPDLRAAARPTSHCCLCSLGCAQVLESCGIMQKEAQNAKSKHILELLGAARRTRAQAQGEVAGEHVAAADSESSGGSSCDSGSDRGTEGDSDGEENMSAAANALE